MTVLCAIRKTSVAATPEEIVRQGLLKRMIGTLGYPQELIAVEKELSQLPHIHLLPQNPPERRVDVICFAKGDTSELFPLLLVECKAVALTQKVVSQVTGYNYFVKSRFVAVVNAEELKTGWYDPTLKEYRFVPYLPPFKDLLFLHISNK